MIDFIDNIVNENTWIRVVYVLLGAVLVYYALMDGPANRFISSMT